MKSFEERKAEVMLRSEIIVKKRKRRNKIILTLVPITICICALSVTAIPTFFSGKKNSSAESTPSETASETESYTYTAPEEPPKNGASTSGSTANTSSATSSTAITTAILEDNVTVYYLTENGIESEEIFLPCTPKDVFSAWKTKNGIGDEVELIRTEIKDNSVTESSEKDGSKVITHTIGDYFILNITVSKSLESYYSSHGEELLCESLKKTMTGYNGIEFDEYYLYLE